ncbi:MAG TPA: DUF4268 domain-containing protein [Desulfobacterales bacterium]|nr:DUF4268 domain-containing protein [Desulfobacterales bacterium]
MVMDRLKWPTHPLNTYLDFTKWLQDNIDVLNEVIDLDLSNPESEQSAGAFSVDLVAEDESGNPVIIENQLEKSNHDHLGKILTYLVAMGAKTAIWIVADPRPEHISAITWLNESSSANFYLLKMEAIKIDNSTPAPLLTVIVGPSEEGKGVGKTKKEMAERYLIRERFWTQLLNLSKQKTKLHANISPTRHNWLGTSAGINGLAFNYGLRKNEAQVELYIDRGKERDEENKAIFEKLFNHKEDIEKIFGNQLEWQKLEGKRACRIRKRIKVGGYRDGEEKVPQIHEAMVNDMISLERALRSYIKKLRI